MSSVQIQASTAAVMSPVRIAIVVVATALGIAAGGCAATGTTYRPTPAPPGCDLELVTGHVPGHLDGVWQLACVD